MRTFFSPTSLIGRLINLFRSSSHDLLDRVQDPGSQARQIIRQLSSDIGGAEEALAAIKAEEILATRNVTENKAKAESWATKATTAYAAGETKLGDSALNVAERAARHAALSQSSVDVLRPRIGALEQKLAMMRGAKEDAELEINVLDARARVAKVTADASRTIGGIGTGGPDLASVRSTVDRMEATSEALADVAATRLPTLEDELSALDGSSSEQRLEALRARLHDIGERHECVKEAT